MDRSIVHLAEVIDLELGQTAVAGIGPVDGKPDPFNLPGRESDCGSGFAIILQVPDLYGGAPIAEGQRPRGHAMGRIGPVVQTILCMVTGFFQSSCTQHPDASCLLIHSLVPPPAQPALTAPAVDPGATKLAVASAFRAMFSPSS